MASLPLVDVRNTLADLSKKDFSNFTPRMIDDAQEKLKSDVDSLKNNPLLKEGVEVYGAIYDVDTGKVNWID